MSKLYEWWFDRWWARANARAWKDPEWAAIQQRRMAPGEPGAIWLSHDLSLGDEERVAQDRIWDCVNPPALPQKLHWWLDAHGVATQRSKVRRFVQRGRRGWADEDLWDFDSWLARVIATAIPVLAERSHLLPGPLGEEQWAETLATIAAGYQLYVDDRDACYDAAGEPTGVFARAQDLLHGWFGALWD